MLTEMDVAGVFVSPYAAILLACWGLTVVLRSALSGLGILARVWNQALLMFICFAAMFSAAVLLAVST